MKIKLSYDTRDELPKGMEELYEEKDGKFVLTGVEGLKTDGDVSAVRTSLVAERAAHKKTKDELRTITSAIGDMKPEEIAARLDLVDELQATVDANKGKDGKDDAAIERIVETRVKRALAPVERERDGLKKQVGELTAERDGLSTERKKDKIGDAVRKAATEMKVLGPAMDDVILNAERIFELGDDGRAVTRDDAGVTPGLTPDVWLKDMQEKRPHWWPTSNGGGAMGSGGKTPGGGAGNPWSAAHWNMTEQGKYLTAHGAEKANMLAKQAGTSVGGPRPAAKA